MALSKEEVQELKAQLREQVAHLPDDQKQAALQQIDEMSDEAVELMLKQQQEQSQSQPIFRMIVEGKIPSKKIAENPDAIAVLSTKPISKGHVLVIPKSQVTKSPQMPTSAFDLAQKVSAKIVAVLKAEGTEIQTQFAFSELVIHVIPVYDKPVSINSQPGEADEKELEELAQKLFIAQEKPKPKVIKEKPKPKKKEIVKLKRKIA